MPSRGLGTGGRVGGNPAHPPELPRQAGALFDTHTPQNFTFVREIVDLSLVETANKVRRTDGAMTSPVIALRHNLTGRMLSGLANDVVKQATDGWPSELAFDFSRLGFISPAGVVFLSNLIYWLNEQGTRVTFVNTNAGTDALRFLDDSLFFQQHCGAKINEHATPRPTTRPLVRIAQRDSHSWVQANLLPWLSDRLHMTEASLYSLKACISELFNNIQDHTRYDIGSIFVQHFPREKRVVAAISDFGLGIPDSVRKKVPGLSDQDAILKAVEEGFTTKSRPANQGIGLDYLLKTVVVGNGGRVTIFSRRGIVQFLPDPHEGNGMLPQPVTDTGFSPGTTIEISLRTDTIEMLPEEREELEW